MSSLRTGIGRLADEMTQARKERDAAYALLERLDERLAQSKFSLRWTVEAIVADFRTLKAKSEQHAE